MSKSTSKPAPAKSAGKPNGVSIKSQSRPKPPETPAAKVQAPLGTSKLDAMVAQLSRPQGATIADLMQVTGWQAHSVRGAIAGACKKRRGLNVLSESTQGGRVYRIQPVAAG
jgi:hypothetical protein